MFLSILSKNPKEYRKALNTEVFDKLTGEKISGVIWADDETGQYEQCVKDLTTGQIIFDKTTGKPITVVRTGDIEFRPVIRDE